MADAQPTPQELAEQDAIGSTLAAVIFGGATLGSALLAIQVFMVFYGLSVFSGLSKKEREGRLRYIVISLVILATSSADTIMDIWGCYRTLYTGGPDGRSYIDANAEYFANNGKIMVASDAMLLIVLGVGDALMLWRCFILWGYKRWVVLIPCLTCIGAIASMVAGLVFGLGRVNAGSPLKAQITSLSLSVAKNVITTGLILCRLMMTWLQRRKDFPGQKSPRMYSDVTAVIIESAAPLTLFGVLLIATTAVVEFFPFKSLPEQVRAVFTSEFMSWLYYSFCALSPQMIIFRVTTGKSWKNATDSQDGEATFSQPIQFVHDVQARSTSSDLTNSV